MSQQEFFDLAPRNVETRAYYEEQEWQESPRTYQQWEEGNNFADRHLLGEKVYPRADKKAPALAMLPLVALLLLMGGGIFGMALASRETPSFPTSWNDNGFPEGHFWHHHHRPYCAVIVNNDSQEFLPVPPGQGDSQSHFVVVSIANTCDRP